MEVIFMIDNKKVLFSGMQATGNLTLGNYLGALKNWVTLCDEYECFYSVVDMHSITVRQDPAELRKRARNLLTLYIAAGLDPKKNCIYYQSHVSGHAELAWILNCFTYTDLISWLQCAMLLVLIVPLLTMLTGTELNHIETKLYFQGFIILVPIAITGITIKKCKSIILFIIPCILPFIA